MLYFQTILPRDSSRRTTRDQKAAKMNFFGMGPMEIVVIAVVGLIIFGPGKLPEVAGQVGKAVRDFRRLTTDLSSEFEKTAGLNEIKQTVQKELAGIQSEVSGVTAGVKKDLQSTTSSAKKPSTTSRATPSPAAAKTGATTASKSGTTTSKATTTTAKTVAAKPEPVRASKADPLADVSFLDDLPAAKSAPKPAAVAAVASSAPAPEVNDALARARARRQQAGYNRAAHL
jgi:Tat protein translocase TatB subunit